MALLSNRTYRRARANVLARSDVCWLCGHSGAQETDHVIPIAVAPDLYDLEDNLRPSHGTRSPCPVCGIRCNQARGSRDPHQPRRPPINSRRW